MTTEEVILYRLAGQHLTERSDTRTVIRDLCGVQAQFLTHALHALSIRSREVDTADLVKTWTLRGTMHLIHTEDLPLFFHRGRSHFLRPVDTLESDAYADESRKRYFADRILDAVGQGIQEREALKSLCREAGMTDREEISIFDPWGGTIRALCEEGSLCHKVQEKKAFQLCPAFTPMDALPAQAELLRRYIAGFGPVTLRDAAYFFGKPQRQVKQWLSQLDVFETDIGGQPGYYLPRPLPAAIPEYLFLAGFDQLVLGYEKSETPFLPQEYLRQIFAPGGIVRPVLLVNGIASGWWKRKGKALTITLFTPAERQGILHAAQTLWPGIRVTFAEAT